MPRHAKPLGPRAHKGPRTSTGRVIHQRQGVGRPSLYDPAFCERVVTLAKDGLTLTEIAIRLGVLRATLYEWEASRPEFSDALSRARELSKGWWEAKARNGLEKQVFQANLWTKIMAARFPDEYAERRQLDVSVNLAGLVEGIAKLEQPQVIEGTASAVETPEQAPDLLDAVPTADHSTPVRR